MLQATTNELGSKGVTELFLEVRPSNQAAVNLYQSMGFEYKQKRQDYYLGVAGMREDAWVFSLKHR
jgi:ribosomal-protein-alanine N-acetyltransferase